MNMHTGAPAGVLSDSSLKSLFSEFEAYVGYELEEGQIQPASMDLRLGERGYQMAASVLPGKGGIEDKIDRFCVDEINLDDSVVLDVGKVYLIELQEAFDLPHDISARANPKSSTGRLDVFVRVLTQHSVEYDAIPGGYQGPLWLEVVPRTFPIRVRRGSRLTQVRFRRGNAVLNDTSLAAFHEFSPIVDSDRPTLRNGLCVGLDLSPRQDGVVGWKARPTLSPVDVDQIGALSVEQFWEPVLAKGSLLLEPEAFYILASLEAVSVPLNMAAEMVPFDAGVGEFRAHYAGFFDPGFGMEIPSRAVLEVRVRDVPLIVEHGQTVAKLSFEALDRAPVTAYGSLMRSNYQGQGLKLSKHFAVAG